MTTEKIIQMIDEYLEEPHSISQDWVEALQICKQALLDKETEEKHGQWLPQIVAGQRAWVCSECNTLGSPQWKLCPLCGARMDGDK